MRDIRRMFNKQKNVTLPLSLLLFGLVAISFSSIQRHISEEVFVATLTGTVFQDVNNNGVKDPGEPGLPNISVFITDANGAQQTPVTSGDPGFEGTWTVSVPPGATVIDINDADVDFPPGATLTVGSDPKTVNAVDNQTIFTGNVGYASLGCLTGHVYLDIDGNGLQDIDDPNVSQATVIIQQVGNPSNTTSVTTDDNGDWIVCVLPGDYQSNVVITSSSNIPNSSVQTDGTNPTTTTVLVGQTIQNSEDIDGFFPPQSGLLTGEVYFDQNNNGERDAGEQGIADVDIFIDSVPSGNFFTTATDSNGQWSISLIPGDYISDVVENTVSPSCSTGYIRTENSDGDVNTVIEEETTFSGRDGFFCSDPSLELIKSGTYVDVNNNGIDAGDIIEYNFEITNTGNRIILGIEINDPLLEGPNGVLNGGPIDLDIGESDASTFTGIYIIQQQDIVDEIVCNSATAQGETPEGFTVIDVSDDANLQDNGNTEDPTCVQLINNCNASFSKSCEYIDTNGNGEIDLGDTIEYTFTVSNTGSQFIDNITLTDALLGYNNADVFTPNSVGAGNEIQFVDTYFITQADIDQGEVQNSATLNWNCSNGTSDSATDDCSVTLQINPALELFKTATYQDTNNDGQINVGDQIFYEFLVINTGNTQLSNVIITDDLLGGQVAGPVTINFGGSFSSTALYDLTQANIDAGSVCNSATVVGQTAGGQTVNDVSDSTNPDDDTGAGNDITCISTPTGDIQLTKTGVYVDNGDGAINDQDVIQYTFIIENTGSFEIDNIILNDPLLGGNIVLPSTSLQPGENITITFPDTPLYNITNADIANGQVCNTAEVEGSLINGNSVSDIITECTVFNTIEDLSLEKDGVYEDTNGDGIINVGDHINYTFTVTNTGNVTIENITIIDNLVDIDDNSPQDLLPGETTEFFSTSSAGNGYPITNADIASGQVTNIAEAEGTSPQGEEVDASDVEIVPLNVIDAIELIKEITNYEDSNADQTISAGDIISYTFSVTNTGNTVIENLSIDDNDIGISGITVTPSTLNPDQTASATATYTLTQNDIDAGEFCNSAIVAGDSIQTGGQVEDVSDSANPLDGNANDDPTCFKVDQLEIVKSGIIVDFNNNGFIDAGDQIQYSFTVTNTGNNTITDIVITDPLDGIVLSGSSFDLNQGESNSTSYTAFLELTQELIDGGDICNTATATGISSTTNAVISAEDTICLDPEPNAISELSIIKEGTLNLGDDGISSVGDLITYTFTVTNTGQTTISNIIVTDTELAFSASLSPNVLVPGATGTITQTVTYAIDQDDIDLGQFCNTAIANGQDPLGNAVDAQDEECTEIPEPTPGIEILKVGVFNDENGDGLAQPGETISYTFTVTNTGEVSLSNVFIDDPLVTVLGGPINLNIGQTDTTTFTATYTVSQDDINVGVVLNTAEVCGLTPLGETICDEDNDEVTLPSSIDDSSLNLLKTGEYEDSNNNGQVGIGDQIIYTFVLTNTSNVTLFNVEIDDENDIGITIEIGTLLPGETVEETVAYDIIQADLAAGRKVNSALAQGVTQAGQNTQDISDAGDITIETPNADGTTDGDPTNDPTIVELDVPDDIIFYNGITPNGDGVNDVLIIENIENFPNNSLKIFNRWGVLVYEAEAYGSIKDAERVEFDGTSDGRITIAQGEKLPTGTYIYIFEYVDFLDRTQELTGFIYINAD